MSSEESMPVVVEKVIAKGRHGPYAVAYHEILGSITVALEPEIWKEEEWPETGMFIVVSKLRRKRAGWRALAARYMQPCDEKQVPKRPKKPRKQKAERSS